jgi:agmatinase
MVKFLASNVNSISEAQIIIIGFPDESKSDSIRLGTKKAPGILRRVYNDTQYFENTPISPMSGVMNKKVYDFGNSCRRNLHKLVSNTYSSGKFPIIIGGDHSLTTLTLRAIKNSSGEKLGLLYFDAHPDFLSSITDFHGSVLSDSEDCIDFKRSMLIGIRAAEPEELENLRKYHLEYVSPLEIIEEGLSKVAKRMISKCKTASRVYLSIDLDCLDSGIAPGVTVPEAAGLMPLELIFLVKKACSNLPVIGFDLVELCPDYDVNHNTVNIAAKLLKETLASILVPVEKKSRNGSKKSGRYQ